MATMPLGKTSTGAAVARIVLRGHGLQVAVLTYGAALQSVRLDGVDHDLTLGSDDLAQYEGRLCYHGTIVGPVANRLTNAKALINSTPHSFVPNEAAGHFLHGGPNGTQAQVWHIVQADDTAVTLSLGLQDDGFPGHRTVQATYAILPDATLLLTISGTTDAPTVLNLAHHGYWNMDGTPTWAGHRLQIAAAHYLPTDAGCAPTGAVQAVMGTAYDFQQARAIGIDDPFIDNNFCLSHQQEPLRDVLWLTGQSGVRLTVGTTEPGVQVYNGPHGWGAGGLPHGGIAIEPQGWPDAPNHAHFPSIALTPAQNLQQVTRWRFDRV